MPAPRRSHLARLLLPLALAAPPAPALSPDARLAQLIIRTWTTDEGLPLNSINALWASPRGPLWVATEEGLTRFDGVSFAPFGQGEGELPNQDVNDVFEDPDGTLWISSWGGVTRFREGLFQTFDTRNGLPHDVVYCALRSRGGELFAGTARGLARLRGDHFEVFVDPTWQGQLNVRALVEDRRGALWVASSGGGLSRFEGGRFDAHFGAAELGDDWVQALALDSAGRVWVGTRKGAARIDDPETGAVTRFGERDGLTVLDVRRIIRDPHGQMWLGTYGGGLLHFTGGRFEGFRQSQGLAFDNVGALAFDLEGGLWVGTLGGGLNHLSEGQFLNIGEPEGLTEDVVWAVLEDRQGRLWVGTDGGGVCRQQATEPSGWRCFGKSAGLPSDVVIGLHEDTEGTLWLATPSGVASVRTTASGDRVRSYGSSDGLGNEDAYVVGADPEGAILVGTSGGVFRLRPDDRFESVSALFGLDDASPVNAFLVARDRSLWIATNGQGIRRIQNGQAETIETGVGLRSRVVVGLYEDRLGNLWVSSLAGLARRTASGWQHFGRAQGLPTDQIWSAIEDSQGRLWMPTNRGVVSVPLISFEDVIHGRATRLEVRLWTRADGLRSPEFNLGRPAAFRARDGRLWFPTTRGATAIDPMRLLHNPIPPAVAITDLRRDGRPLVLSPPLRLEAGVETLEFRFEAYSFRAPERVRFRHRLEGFDDGWKEIEGRRSAFYTRPPAGHYRLLVEAANDDGLWSREPALLSFDIAPQPWERTSFRLLLAAAVAALGALGVWLRNRRRLAKLHRRQRELEIEVRGRTQELHHAKQALEEHAQRLEASNRLLEELALQDGLTGAVNRRGFDQALERETAAAVRRGSPLSLLLLDVDHFKLYNDHLGHLAGDDCLRAVADLLRSGLRGGDLLARYGGEEFAVLLPDADVDDAVALAERLRHDVQAGGLRHPASPTAEAVTISIGVATMTRIISVAHAAGARARMLADADAALYRAKERGRNRVEAA